MQVAPIPINEAERLEALYQSNLLDSPPEERFDRITRITQRLFNAPSVFVALVDKERVWFKSKYGSDADESPRELSICGHSIYNDITDDESRLFEVVDTNNDDRFFDNSFITESSKIRYYLGFVLQSVDKLNIGVFCLVDTKPRRFSDSEKKLFSDLGFIVEAEVNKTTSEMGTKLGGLLDNLPYEKNPQAFTNCFLNISDKFNSTFPTVKKHLKKNGINFKEWRILNEIIQTEVSTSQQISQKLHMSASLLSQYLESLELQGLIHRSSPKRGDKRFVKIECTPAGEKIWAKGMDTTYEIASSYLADM